MLVLMQQMENPNAYGVVLLPTGSQKGCYLRVGLFQFTASFSALNTLENLETWMRAGLPVGDDEFESVDRACADGIPRYTVVIV